MTGEAVQTSLPYKDLEKTEKHYCKWKKCSNTWQQPLEIRKDKDGT